MIVRALRLTKVLTRRGDQRGVGIRILRIAIRRQRF
jgi:hypothetical protein